MQKPVHSLRDSLSFDKQAHGVMAEWAKAWRLELFHKSQSELKEKTVPLLLDNSCHRLNITNKVKPAAADGSPAPTRELSSQLAAVCREKRTLCTTL